MDSVNPDLTPALPPPEGVTPNFVNPYQDVNTERALCFVFLGFATVLLIARLFTRIKIMKKVGWEDCRLAFTCICHWLTRNRHLACRMGLSERCTGLQDMSAEYSRLATLCRQASRRLLAWEEEDDTNGKVHVGGPQALTERSKTGM